MFWISLPFIKLRVLIYRIARILLLNQIWSLWHVLRSNWLLGVFSLCITLKSIKIVWEIWWKSLKVLGWLLGLYWFMLTWLFTWKCLIVRLTRFVHYDLLSVNLFELLYKFLFNHLLYFNLALCILPDRLLGLLASIGLAFCFKLEQLIIQLLLVCCKFMLPIK